MSNPLLRSLVESMIGNYLEESYEDDLMESIFEEVSAETWEAIEEAILNELSPKTLTSYMKKSDKSLDKLSSQRGRIVKEIKKHYDAINKRSAAEKAAYRATTQSQHNKATAAYRAADKSVDKANDSRADLNKQHVALTRKINKRMDGQDRAYDKLSK
jgi:hypothetical protein